MVTAKKPFLNTNEHYLHTRLVKRLSSSCEFRIIYVRGIHIIESLYKEIRYLFDRGQGGAPLQNLFQRSSIRLYNLGLLCSI